MLGRSGWRTSLVAVSFLIACGDAAPPDLFISDAALDAGAKDAGPEAGLGIRPAEIDASGVRPPADAGRDATPPDEDDGGPPPNCDDLDCSGLDDACNVGACDSATVTCIAVPVANGTACGSEIDDACTDPDTCRKGVCRPNDAPRGTSCGDDGELCHFDDECDGDGLCEDKGLWDVGTLCGNPTDTECDNPDSCNAAGQCVPRHEPFGNPCGDQGDPCRYDDGCDGSGECSDGGDWSPGTLCGGLEEPSLGACHPTQDICDASGGCVSGNANDGTACGDPANTECDNPDACLAGACVPNYETSLAPCGDTTTDDVCNQADSCDGAGGCSPNYAASGVVCDDPPGDCLRPPECSGGGACQPQPGFAPAGTPCGDATATACDLADVCDVGGGCLDNPAPPGTSCGDPSVTECSDPDGCDGSGACQENHLPTGTLCGDQGLACLYDDACDAGNCVDNGIVAGCLISVTGTVIEAGTGTPLEGITVTVLDSNPVSSDVTDANGAFTIEVPPAGQVLLHFGAAASYWGRISAYVFTPDMTDMGTAALYDDATAEAFLGMVSGLPPLDVGKGAVRVEFGNPAPSGGESAALGASSAPPVVFDSVGNPVLSSMLLAGSVDPAITFINTTVGTTTVNVAGASGITACSLRYPSVGSWPVVPHTLTTVAVDCVAL